MQSHGEISTISKQPFRMSLICSHSLCCSKTVYVKLSPFSVLMSEWQIFSCLLVFRSDPSSKSVPSHRPVHRGIQEVQIGRGVSGLSRRWGCEAAGHQYRSHILSLALQLLTQIWTGWGKAPINTTKCGNNFIQTASADVHLRSDAWLWSTCQILWENILIFFVATVRREESNQTQFPKAFL